MPSKEVLEAAMGKLMASMMVKASQVYDRQLKVKRVGAEIIETLESEIGVETDPMLCLMVLNSLSSSLCESIDARHKITRAVNEGAEDENG